MIRIQDARLRKGHDAGYWMPDTRSRIAIDFMKYRKAETRKCHY